MSNIPINTYPKNIGGWASEPAERREFVAAPFTLRDNDGPSHLWVIAYMLEDKHGLEATANNIRERAKQWAEERAKAAVAAEYTECGEDWSQNNNPVTVETTAEEIAEAKQRGLTA